MGMTCAHQDPLAYPGQRVFLTAPYPTQAVGKAWPTPCPSTCQLTKQLLAVQLLSVEGAGTVEQGVVFGVHGLNLVQCGFSTPDPLAGEIRRVALKVQLSLMPRPSLCTTDWGTWNHFWPQEIQRFLRKYTLAPPGTPVQHPPPFIWGPWGKTGCKG